MKSNRKMPTIGVVGVTIPGALDCISKINTKSNEKFNHHEYPNIILDQKNFEPTHDAQNAGRWDIVKDRLLTSLEFLKWAKADFAIIPANTVHRVIDELLEKSPIPILSMLDAVVNECKDNGIRKLGILGTKWTMADHLYRTTLNRQGIEEIVPSLQGQEIVQKAIFDELIPTGKASSETLTKLLDVVRQLKESGCDGIALACTELPLVLNDENCGVKTIDTNAVLAKAAIAKASALYLTQVPSVESANLEINRH